MKIIKHLYITLFVLALSIGQIHAQDNRTLDTKIADLLVQVPADNEEQLNHQMKSLLELQEAGLQKILDQVIPLGTGDDTKPRMAVESLSRYLSQAGKEKEKAMWESMLLVEIDGRKGLFVKSFLISQLNYIGGVKSVEKLSPYLTDPILYDPAIRAMKDADPKLASEKFADNLNKTTVMQQVALINALGNIGNSEYALAVSVWAGSGKQALQKSVLTCLAKLGHPDSYDLLMYSAKSVDYRAEPSHATASLLDYAQTLSEKDEHKLSLKICKTVDKKCFHPDQVHFRSGALIIAAGNEPMEESVTLLVNAMKNENKPYRMAAIRYAIENGSPSTPWVNELNSTKNSEIKTEILYLLGQLGQMETAPTVRVCMSDPDQVVRKQAVESMALILKEEAVPYLIRYTLAFPQAPDTEFARTALLQCLQKDQLEMLEAQLGESPEGAKVVFTEVIASKEDPGAFDILFDQVSQTGPVRDVSIEKLYLVSSGEHLDKLFSLFDGLEDKDKIMHIEKALIASINGSADKQQATHKVIEHASGNPNYTGVLAAVGGEEAMNAVYSIYSSSEGQVKEETFDALVRSNDVFALKPLFEICSKSSDSSEKIKAFDSYATVVYTSDLPEDQKLLLLRKIEPLAANSTSTMLLIKAMGSVKNFLSFVFLSQYMENEALQTEAANALIRVALPSQGQDNGLEGDLVRDGLLKASKILSGPESEYTRIDIETYLKKMSGHPGYLPMFNGKDLFGWQGLATDPLTKATLSEGELKKLQQEADEKLKEYWSVRDNSIVFNGDGSNLCSIKSYGSFEMIVDWRITKKGDSGLYLRGSPQVQIWDTSRVEVGAQVGSGGLYNNQVYESDPLLVADNPVGEWNTFRIRMIDQRVTVYLNGQLVVDNVVMENYWDRSIPIFPQGSIELQAHGTDLAFRDIYVKELDYPRATITQEEISEGFIPLFNGKDFTGWIGENHSYLVEEGNIVIRPTKGGGNLFTEREYSDFIFRFEFKLTPGANNGLGIRTPLKGDAAYAGYELQILDNTAEVYENLQPYQYHGSVYGILPAKRGYLKPVGEWNSQEVMVKGEDIRITLNGTIIVEGNLKEVTKSGTADGKEHPGLQRTSGHIGFLGHGSLLWFRNIRIKEL